MNQVNEYVKVPEGDDHQPALTDRARSVASQAIDTAAYYIGNAQQEAGKAADSAKVNAQAAGQAIQDQVSVVNV